MIVLLAESKSALDKVISMAEQLGVKMLRQTGFDGNDLVFHGIDDADHIEQVSENLPGLAIDKDRFNVLLYHRPVGWEAAIDHGIDLMLSGHTHNGQIFPFNWAVRQQFDRIAGLYQQKDASLYVSSGTGTWGPLMRLGSFNEVTLFKLKPST
ncbi:MAG: hypothetical protein AAF353_19015 [Pseudomonadota bacterium]